MDRVENIFIVENRILKMKIKWAMDIARFAEHLPSNHKALDLILSDV